jgi:hypothetical protein
MTEPAGGAHVAVLALLGLLASVRDRLHRAPVRRGKPARREAWRAVLADKSADAFPRQLAHKLRAVREHVAPERDALRAARPEGPYPTAAAPVQAVTAAEYVLAVAAEVLDRLDEGLPRGATRSWVADDEIADLAGQLEPLLAGLPADVAAQVEGEFAAAGR